MKFRNYSKIAKFKLSGCGEDQCMVFPGEIEMSRLASILHLSLFLRDCMWHC